MSKKRQSKTRQWLAQHNADAFVKSAQQQGYRARAVFKLQEIDQAHRLLRPGQVIVELGVTPGSWSQYVIRRLGGRCTLIGCDLLDCAPVEGLQFLRGDFNSDAVQAQILALSTGKPIDLVLSDMAPNLYGIKSADSVRVQSLIDAVLAFCDENMAVGGSVVCKAFQGSLFGQCMQGFKQRFKRVRSIKPVASRAQSSEVFIVGQDRKPSKATGD